MAARVDGKIALVTGSTQGIGLAIAEALAGAGAAGLMLTGRDADRGAAAAARLSAEFTVGDLADPQAPERLASACLDRFGRIDILVNAAALTDRASFLDGTPQLWDRLFAVNTRAPFFLMQQAIRAMRAVGQGGAIVNIASINAHCGAPDLAIYSATKGALTTLTKNAAAAHAGDRIRVNAINVGWTDTPGEQTMQAQTLGKGDGWRDDARAVVPLGRLFVPDDIAALALFLASDAAGPMTGAVIDQAQWVIGATQ